MPTINYREILDFLMAERAKLDAAINSIRPLVDGEPGKRRGRPRKSPVIPPTDKRRQPWSEERRLKASQSHKKRLAAKKVAS